MPTLLKPARLAALCVLALGLTGCVRYTRTADVRSRLDGALSKIDAALRQTEQDVGAMRRLCLPLMPSRPRLRFILKRIDASVAALHSYRGEILKLRTEFERMARGRSRIREDRPQWQQLQQLQRRYETVGDEAAKAVEQYKDQATQLLDAVKQAHGA
jgi:DNA repair ATPase RecN